MADTPPPPAAPTAPPPPAAPTAPPQRAVPARQPGLGGVSARQAFLAIALVFFLGVFVGIGLGLAL
jgi:hypothetical protein